MKSKARPAIRGAPFFVPGRGIVARGSRAIEKAPGLQQIRAPFGFSDPQPDRVDHSVIHIVAALFEDRLKLPAQISYCPCNAGEKLSCELNVPFESSLKYH